MAVLGWAKQLLGQNDHPLGDARRVRRWLADLPSNDALKALAELTHAFEALASLNLRLTDRLEVLQLLDEASIGHRNRLAREYLSQTRLPTYRENALWFGVQQFWTGLAQGYMTVLDQAQTAGAPALGGERLLLFLLRGMHATRHSIKWRLLRYMLVDSAQWRSLGRLYVVAENNRLGSTIARLYEGAPTETSPRNELLKVLLLGVSATDSLLPVQTEIASRLIDAVSAGCDWSEKQSPQLAFCFNLLGGRAPLRVVGAPAEVGVWRFFGGQNVQEQLERIQRDAAAGFLSNGVHLGGEYPLHQVALAAEHLQRYWAHPAPERRAERVASYQRIEVVHGFAAVLRHFIYHNGPPAEVAAPEQAEDVIEVRAPDASSVPAEEGDPLYTDGVPTASSLESWVVHNVSASGLGAIIPRVNGDWLQVGQLLALAFLEPRSGWKLAVIRRLHQNAQGQMCVGLEILAQEAVAARICLPGMVLQDEEYALVLDGGTGGELKLLTRVGTLGGSTVAQIEHQGRFSVRPRCCLEKNGSFDLTLVTKISEEALE